MEPSKVVDSVCTYCGVGCDIAATIQNNKIQNIFAHPDGVVSEGKLCVKGKYGFEFLNAPDRLRIPRIRKSFLKNHPLIAQEIASTLCSLDETWYETTLEGATKAAAMKLQEVQKRYGNKISGL